MRSEEWGGKWVRSQKNGLGVGCLLGRVNLGYSKRLSSSDATGGPCGYRVVVVAGEGEGEGEHATFADGRKSKKKYKERNRNSGGIEEESRI